MDISPSSLIAIPIGLICGLYFLLRKKGPPGSAEPKSQLKHAHYISTNVVFHDRETFEPEIRAIFDFLRTKKLDLIAIEYRWTQKLADANVKLENVFTLEDAERDIRRLLDADLIEFGWSDIWIRDRENRFELQVCNDLDLHFSADSKELCDELEVMWKSRGHTITRLEKAK